MNTKERIAFVSTLIGKPWVAGGRGPEVFDCWGLLCYYYREVLGRTLHPYTGFDLSDTRATVRTIKSEFSTGWHPLAIPCDGCAVGMSANKIVTHVGVWFVGRSEGVLHADERRGMVIFQSAVSLRLSGVSNFNFYQLEQ